jgi:hypothetical protein
MRVDPVKPGEKYRNFEIAFKPIAEEVFNTPDPQRILELFVRTTGDSSKIKYGSQATQNERIKF